jgi:hypothetical protein
MNTNTEIDIILFMSMVRPVYYVCVYVFFVTGVLYFIFTNECMFDVTLVKFGHLYNMRNTIERICSRCPTS